MTHETGQAFSPSLMRAVKDRFLHVDQDALGRDRLYFDNAGGAFRLKSAIDCFAHVDAIPDNAERHHATAIDLQGVQARGAADLRIILNATGGSVFASLTASGAMFDMVRAIAENVAGRNMVTTVLEHPSAFDAMTLYAERLGKELRIARSNPATGGVDVDEIVSLVDQDTCLLNVIYASNISGAKLDIEEVVRRARLIKPDLYIVVDAVQHAPHGLIDLQKTPVDGINLAPYKFFGCRGVWFRLAVRPGFQASSPQAARQEPDVWDPGSSAPWQFAVVSAIVDYVCWLGAQVSGVRGERTRRESFVAGMEAIGLHERALLARLLNGSGEGPGLRQMEHVNVLLDHDDLSKRDLILAIGFDHIGCAQAVNEYEKRGVIVYERVSSSLYSKRMLESFGLDGAVRVSPLHCNSEADIDRFLQITRQVAAAFTPSVVQ